MPRDGRLLILATCAPDHAVECDGRNGNLPKRWLAPHHALAPGQRIAQQRVTNYSAPRPHYRQQVRLTLDHALPAEEAKGLLAEAAVSAPGVLPEPPPDARLVAHEPDGLVYVVHYWV